MERGMTLLFYPNATKLRPFGGGCAQEHPPNGPTLFYFYHFHPFLYISIIDETNLLQSNFAHKLIKQQFKHWNNIIHRTINTYSNSENSSLLDRNCPVQHMNMKASGFLWRSTHPHPGHLGCWWTPWSRICWCISYKSSKLNRCMI